MPSLLTVAEARRTITTALSDANLQSIIDQEESELVRRLGAHGDGVVSVTETHHGGGGAIFLRRAPASISSITETAHGGSSVLLTTDQWYLWPGGQLARLPLGSFAWGTIVAVTYVPEDDRARRKQVITELVRLTLEQTAMRSEGVAGEYNYQAPEWEQARARLYRRLSFMEV